VAWGVCRASPGPAAGLPVAQLVVDQRQQAVRGSRFAQLRRVGLIARSATGHRQGGEGGLCNDTSSEVSSSHAATFAHVESDAHAGRARDTESGTESRISLGTEVRGVATSWQGMAGNTLGNLD
jgi:hypothetical protein